MEAGKKCQRRRPLAAFTSKRNFARYDQKNTVNVERPDGVTETTNCSVGCPRERFLYHASCSDNPFMQLEISYGLGHERMILTSSNTHEVQERSDNVAGVVAIVLCLAIAPCTIRHYALLK